MAPARSYEWWGYPLLGLFLLWVAAALAWTRIPVARILSASHLLLSVFWLGLLTSRLFTDAGRATPDLYLLFVLLCIVAYLVFSTRIAAQASVGLLLSTAVIVGAWFVWALWGGRPVASIGSTWTYEAILGATIVMLHALARSKDRHAEALLEAARMRDMAYTDTLTSLPNRRELEERLEHTVEAAHALQQPLSVVFFDLDDFKSVNDAHGHAVGDAVLLEVGNALQTLVRSGDMLGRWGGEEYLLLAPNTGHEQALDLAERLRQGVASHAFPRGIHVTASFGVATTTGNPDARALLARADERLYHAKRAGRNRTVGRDGTPRDRPTPQRATACND